MASHLHQDLHLQMMIPCSLQVKVHYYADFREELPSPVVQTVVDTLLAYFHHGPYNLCSFRHQWAQEQIHFSMKVLLGRQNDLMIVIMLTVEMSHHAWVSHQGQ